METNWLAVADAVCEVQSRCALMVAAEVEHPELVRREYAWRNVCAVMYDGKAACVIVTSGFANHVVIDVMWHEQYKHLESNV